MLWLLFACSPTPDPAPVVPPSPPTAAPDRPTAWVRASTLNVRASPDATGALVGRLPVNTRVAVFDRQGDWVRVAGPSGEQGFCLAQFLADAPLTLDAARSGALAATTPAERLSWWQRAAALAPTDVDVLTGLEAAYREVGEPERAAWVARVRAGEGTPWERWFPPAQRAEADAITAGLQSISRPDELVALHGRALLAANALSEAINQNWDLEYTTDPSPWLLERVPWARLELYAEGTWAQLDLAPDPWKQAASRTPGVQDDAFVRFLVDAYGNAGGTGWPTWFERNWDYGGCSLFGSGKHLELLKASDTLKDPPFGPPLAETRRRILLDIVDGSSEFPFCDPAGGAPTEEARLRAELDHILADVALTPDERAGLEARRTRGFAGP